MRSRVCRACSCRYGEVCRPAGFGAGLGAGFGAGFAGERMAVQYQRTNPLRVDAAVLVEVAGDALQRTSQLRIRGLLGELGIEVAARVEELVLERVDAREVGVHGG